MSEKQEETIKGIKSVSEKKETSELNKKILDALNKGKLVIGFKEVMSAVRNKKCSLVIHSSNCPQGMVSELIHAAKLINARVKGHVMNNKELGVLCRKPFNISVLCVLNEPGEKN